MSHLLQIEASRFGRKSRILGASMFSADAVTFRTINTCVLWY